MIGRLLGRNTEYVIVEPFLGSARRWFRYHPRHVWVWTKHPHQAARFRTYADAEHAAQSCEVSWRHRYMIEARKKHK